ncbi:MAG: glycosyltransferase [Oceanicaulis sp.]
MPFPRWCVALPARDEARRLPGALEALDAAAAMCAGPVDIIVLADHCRDATADLARSAPMRHARIDVIERGSGPELVGAARRDACEEALDRLGDRPGALLLTTDADARVHEEALARMEHAFARGADLACARLDPAPDPFDTAAPDVIRKARAAALRRALIRRLAARRDGGRDLPALHDDYGGAGLALTASAYRRLGGFDAVSHDEDRRLVRAAERAGLIVDRRSRARVKVLARRRGRAPGGMAADLARVAGGAADRVERCDLTLARLAAGNSALDIIEARPEALEPLEIALAGLKRALAAPRAVCAA